MLFWNAHEDYESNNCQWLVIIDSAKSVLVLTGKVDIVLMPDILQNFQCLDFILI